MTHPTITGPMGGDPLVGDPAVFRLEIRDIAKNKYQYSLFIRALQRMLDGRAADPLSFLGIGSIHGLPAESWGGAAPPAPPWYCAHGTELFPTWHRPYVSLIEQEIYRHAQDIVRAYTKVPDRSEWARAALDLRFPFWDWARRIELGQPVVPSVLTSKTTKIWVPTRDGNHTAEHTVNNPLFCGQLKEEYPRNTFRSPYNKWVTSIRYPTTDDEKAESNVAAFQETFSKYHKPISILTYLCLTCVDTWELFSNHGAKCDIWAKAFSLEGIHDTMHNTIGGIVEKVANGHMAEVAVAAFDPIFFLHHANVDRMLALWQAINPDVWVPVKPSATSGDVSANANQTDLLPFWKDQDTFWNSEKVRLYAPDLNYSYPEFKGLKSADPATVRERIIAQVAKLYEAPKSILDILWSLLVVLNRDELGTSYLVEVYIGETLAGVIGAFANGASEDCANCQKTRHARSEGVVHLNSALLGALPRGREHLTKKEVLNTLCSHLHLRIVANKPDHTPVDISRDLPTLKVVPFSHSFELKGPSELPVTGGVTYHDLPAGHPWVAPASFWAQRGIQVGAAE